MTKCDSIKTVAGTRTVKELTTLRSPNTECPSCQAKTLHTKENWTTFHPLAGTGSIEGINP